MPLSDYWRGGATGPSAGLSRYWRSTGNIPDLSQYGAVRTEDIESVTGPLPGSPGMEDPGFMGMGLSGAKRVFAEPFVGLAERLSLVPEGSRKSLIDRFEETRMAYLSADPSPGRAAWAGFSELGPYIAEIVAGGAVAGAAAPAIAKATGLSTRASAVLFGVLEGEANALGVTAGEGKKATGIAMAVGLAGGALAGLTPAAKGASRYIDKHEESFTKWLERELASHGGLGPENKSLLMEMGGRIKEHYFLSGRSGVAMYKDMAKYAKDSRKKIEDVYKEVNTKLQRVNGIDDLPVELRASAKVLRNDVDALTKASIKMEDMLTESQKKAYKKHHGIYLHRSRQAWDDPDFVAARLKSNVSGEEWKAARKDLMDPDGWALDPEQADAYLWETLFRIEDAQGKPFRLGKPGLKPIDKRVRKHRRTKTEGWDPLKNATPDSIREFLGEWNDPVVNYRKSILYMASDLEGNRAYNQIAQNLIEDKHAIMSNRRTPEYRYAGPSGSFGQLSGRAFRSNQKRRVAKSLWFKDKDLVEAFEESREVSREGIIYLLSGTTKAMKTIYSPITAVRNFISGLPMMTLQGHLPVFRKGGQVAKTVGQLATDYRWARDFVPDAEVNRAVNALVRHGVAQDSLVVGDVLKYMDDAQGVFQGGRIRNFIREKIVKAPAVLYQGADDFWKTQQFMAERSRLVREFAKDGITMADERLDKISAMIVKEASGQIYSRIPKAAKRIRDFPLTGPFVSFPAEITHNIVQTVRLGLDEVGATSGKFLKQIYGDLDPTQLAAVKRIGRRRLMGTAATLAMPAIAEEALRRTSGMSREQLVALKESNVPPWSENSKLGVIGYDQEKNDATYIDLSFADPYNFVKKPLSALSNLLRRAASGSLDGDGLRHVENIISETLSPITQPEIWSGEVFRTIEALGKMQSVPRDEKAKMLLYRLHRMLSPGAVISAERFIRGLDMEGVRTVLPATSEYGKRFNPGHEMAATFLGVRISATDIPRSLQYKAGRYSSARGEGKRLFTREERNKADRSLYRLNEAKRAAEDTNQKAGIEILRHIENARTLGLTNQQIIRQLNAGGVGKKDAIDLVYYGKIPPIRF